MDFLNHPITNTALIWMSVVTTFIWVASIIGAYLVGLNDGCKQFERDEDDRLGNDE